MSVCALALLLLLCACSPIYLPVSPDPEVAPTSAPGDTVFGVWASRVDCAEALLADFPTALPELSEPVRAAVSLRIDENGLCRLTVDYAPCAEPLQAAFAALLRSLEDAGETLPGDRNTLAEAMADELLPRTLQMGGTLSAEDNAILWQSSESSTLLLSDGTLRLVLSTFGQLEFLPSSDGSVPSD